jgi:peptide/nickel transport system substrate-binding protein
VWVANEADGTLSRIEPGQTPVRTVIGSVPQGLVGASGGLWVSVRGTATSHRGGTLRMLSLYGPQSLDPTVAYDPISWRPLHLLGDGLVSFEPIGGTDATLVPDLARSIPTPPEDGLAYTFTLRSGIRYSNGEVVAPVDFRYALERGFRLYTSAHADLYGGLVGGDACAEEPRTCDLSRGVVTDDETGAITFRLVDPDPEFLYKLTMPFAYPVPASTPEEEQVTEGIPGTGPYMLEAPMTDGGVALVRNDLFRVWSPAAQPDGYVDRIEWTFGVKPEAQVEAVAAGDADIAFDAVASGSLADIIVRFAAQVHASPKPVTYFVVLDTQTPPFDDVEVRRALNIALDRDRVVQILGGEGTALPTCQQLPPNFPGYEPYCPYTMNAGPKGEGSWTAPDPEKAKRIVRRSDTAGMRVTFDYYPFLPDPQQHDLLGDYIIELFASLGYDANVRSVSDVDFYDPARNFQMAFDAWGADYPAASNFITNRFTCDASSAPSAGFCDPEIDAMIERAIQTQTEDPAAAGALWATIDRKIVDEAPYLWLVNTIAVDFVSERVGNYQFNSQWRALLNQLWVQ